MRGRKPKPTLLKLIAGNPGKRPLNQKEPKYLSLDAAAPEELQHEKFTIAKAEWERVVAQLIQAGIAKRIDRTALLAYCLEYQKWLTAENGIRDVGMFVKTGSGFVTLNPHARVSRNSLEMMLRLMGEFGMTPSSRVRLHADIPAAEVDPFDEYLKAKA